MLDLYLTALIKTLLHSDLHHDFGISCHLLPLIPHETSDDDLLELVAKDWFTELFALSYILHLLDQMN